MTYQEKKLENKLLQIAAACNRVCVAGLSAATVAAVAYCAEWLPVLSGLTMISGMAATITGSLIGSLISK